MDLQTDYEQIARLCHEVNRAYCEATGDFSQKPWEEAEAWQRESAITGVREVLTTPDITPRQTFEAWKAHKLADGWTYGPVKSAEAKTHPCLVEYDDLPAEQKIKDNLFIAVIRTMTAKQLVS